MEVQFERAMPMTGLMTHAWPPVGNIEEPLRTPLWVIRTLADALAAEEQPSEEHRRHVARQIARIARELEA